MEICGASSELLLIFFGLSSVNDKHNIRNSDTGLSNVRGQDNLQQMQNRLIFQAYRKILILFSGITFY